MLHGSNKMIHGGYMNKSKNTWVSFTYPQEEIKQLNLVAKYLHLSRSHFLAIITRDAVTKQKDYMRTIEKLEGLAGSIEKLDETPDQD
jgi:hypothetical protein